MFTLPPIDTKYTPLLAIFCVSVAVIYIWFFGFSYGLSRPTPTKTVIEKIKHYVLPDNPFVKEYF